MYEGLREGLRAATQVSIVQFESVETCERIIRIYRKGEYLWEARFSNQIMAENGIVEHIARTTYGVAQEYIDQVLRHVDWDSFFPIETKTTQLNFWENKYARLVEAKMFPDANYWDGYPTGFIDRKKLP